jgi:hypothetical protein
MVEPKLRALAEGLNATKRRAFVIKAGEILYTDPEPDHRVERSNWLPKMQQELQRAYRGLRTSVRIDQQPVVEIKYRGLFRRAGVTVKSQD